MSRKTIIFVQARPPRPTRMGGKQVDSVKGLADALDVFAIRAYCGTPFWNQFVNRASKQYGIPVVSTGRQVSLILTEAGIEHVPFISLSSNNKDLENFEYVAQAVQDLKETLNLGEKYASQSRKVVQRNRGHFCAN